MKAHEKKKELASKIEKAKGGKKPFEKMTLREARADASRAARRDIKDPKRLKDELHFINHT